MSKAPRDHAKAGGANRDRAAKKAKRAQPSAGAEVTVIGRGTGKGTGRGESKGDGRGAAGAKPAKKGLPPLKHGRHDHHEATKPSGHESHGTDAKREKHAKPADAPRPTRPAKGARPGTHESPAPEPKKRAPVIEMPSPRPAPRAVRSDAPHKAGKIAIVGRPNVGKSTLLNALLGEHIAIVSKHPQTTRDRIAGVVTTPDAQLVFLDTPGIHHPRTKLGVRMNDVAWETANEADVIVFLAEAYVDSKDPVHNTDRVLLPKMPNKPTILALTKIDLVKQKANLFPILEKWNAVRDFSAIVPISALKTSGMKQLISAVTDLLPEGDSLFPEDEISDRPARFFVAEFVREQILKKTFEEIPHGIAVTVERYDESGKIPVIELAVHVNKEAHKRIVIGSGGELLKVVGTEARIHTEKLLGTQVHMKLWVRVTSDWQDNDANLRDFGYRT